jgi:hypothetical protein
MLEIPAEKETTMSVVKAREPSNSEALVWDLLERTQNYLRLKDYNRVQVLLGGHLVASACELHPLPSPALIRLQISSVEAGDGPVHLRSPYCEWRIASAQASASGKRDRFWNAQGQIQEFLAAQFGGEAWPHLDKMVARMIMREPLGIFAVMEGDTDHLVRMPRNGFVNTGAFKLVQDMNPVPEFQNWLL